MNDLPAPGWYRVDPGSEGWWDGTQWTQHRRTVPCPGPAWPGGERPTAAFRQDRIRWAGGYWGGLNPWVSMFLGFFLTLPTLFLVASLFTGAWPLKNAVILAMLCLLMLAMAAVVFINAHFGFVLRRRRRPY